MSIFTERDLLADFLYYPKEISRYQYSLPLRLPAYTFWTSSPAHKDQFKHAVDIAVPDPREQQTIVYAPQSGIVRKVVMDYNTWGTEIADQEKLNYITVDVGGSEFYQLAHIGFYNHQMPMVGEKVNEDDPLATVTLNGQITITNGKVDSHLHILVGRWVKGPEKFTSLKIRWSKPIKMLEVGC